MDAGAKTVGIVALVIGVVLFSAVLVPVIGGSNTTYETVRNNVSDSNNYYGFGPCVISFDGTGFTIDGESMTFASGSIVAMGPNLYLSKAGMKYYEDNTRVIAPTGPTETTPWTFTLEESGTITFVVPDDPTTETSEAFDFTGKVDVNKTIHRTIDGPYYRGDNTSKINANTMIVLFPYTQFTNSNFIYGYTTAKEVVQVYWPSPTDTGRYAMANITVAETDEAGVYTISDAKTANAETQLYWLVPIEYKAPVQAEGTLYTILNMIPILAVLGIAVATIGFVMSRNN